MEFRLRFGGLLLGLGMWRSFIGRAFSIEEFAGLAQGLLCSSFLVGYGLPVSDYTRVGVCGAYIDI